MPYANDEVRRLKNREYGARYREKKGKELLARRRDQYYRDREKILEKARQRHAQNREEDNARCRAFYHANREYNLQRRKDWGEQNKQHVKARARKNRIKKDFGITIEQRDAMLASQGGTCAVCSSTTPGPRDWHTDHCHTTGKIRGILCHHCNVGLGHFKDDPELMQKAIEYLHQGK